VLDREFKYFIDHQEELVKKYNGRFIVVVGDKVTGDFATEVDAYVETIKTQKPGTFLIQQCVPGQAAYKQTFHSRVSFA
jgi:hypothetical protein